MPMRRAQWLPLGFETFWSLKVEGCVLVWFSSVIVHIMNGHARASYSCKALDSQRTEDAQLIIVKL